MNLPLNGHQSHVEEGFTLIEVLIAIMILSFGLLGLAGLQARATVSEAESFGRTQALLLLQDMGTRLAANSTGFLAGNYHYAGNTFGTGYVGTDPNCAALPASAGIPEQDLCAWSDALKAATKLPEARGCIAQDAADPREVIIAVAWRGRDYAVTPPGTDETCGSAAITAGRRVVSQRIRFPNLSCQYTNTACTPPAAPPAP